MLIGKYKDYQIWMGTRGYPCIKICGKEVYLHNYIWEEINGEKPKGFVVHHIDKDKTNYNISNLLLVSNTDHKRIHFSWVMKNGIWTKKKCRGCNKILTLDNFYFYNYRKVYAPRCKKCTLSMHKIKQSTPEKKQKLKEYCQKFYLKNKQKINLYNKNYYKLHKTI